MVGKKGFLFTIISVLLVLLFFAVLQGQVLFENTDEALLTQQRIGSVNQLIIQMKDYLIPDIVGSSARTAMNATLEYMNRTGDMALFETKESLIGNYTNILLYANTSGFVAQQMQNRTLLNNLEQFQNITQEVYRVEIELDVNNQSVDLVQGEPFGLTVFLNVSIGVRSSEGEWLPTQFRVNKTFSIIGLYDPFVANRSHGFITPQIIRAPFGPNDWNVLALDDTITNSWYRPNSDAPSFVQRLYGNLTNHSFGIEVPLRPSDLAIIPDQAININETYIDYLFWDPVLNCSNYGATPGVQFGDLHNITGIDWRFKLQDSQLVKYLNVSNNETQDNSLGRGGLTQTVCSN